jgi:hypothetical protein
MGKAEATSCHEMEARMVVRTAPRRPVLRNVWNPSETPKMFSPVPVYSKIDYGDVRGKRLKQSM